MSEENPIQIEMDNLDTGTEPPESQPLTEPQIEEGMKLIKLEKDLKWMVDFSTEKSMTTLALNASQSMGLILMMVKGLNTFVTLSDKTWLHVVYLLFLFVAFSQYYLYFHRTLFPDEDNSRRTAESGNRIRRSWLTPQF